MIPCPERGRAAAAIAALGMIGIGKDANACTRGLLSFLVHGKHAAAGAAHAATDRIGLPAFFLESLYLFLNRRPAH